MPRAVRFGGFDKVAAELKRLSSEPVAPPIDGIEAISEPSTVADVAAALAAKAKAPSSSVKSAKAKAQAQVKTDLAKSRNTMHLA